jgi:hypothetical protein
MKVNMVMPGIKKKLTFADLQPQDQAKIKHLLLQNNFRAAKILYDKMKTQA